MKRNETALASALMLVVAAAVPALAGGCVHQEGSLRGDTYVARRNLARELVARQQWPAAFAYADELHRNRPDDAEVLVLRGTIYREQGLTAEAEADLLQAIHLDDSSAEAHAALGILYDIDQRPVDAEKQHRAAVTRDPNNAAYLNNLGFSLFLRGKFQDAIQFYSQATRLTPTNRRLRTNLGFALAARGDFRRASHEFDMGGSPAESRNNLGFAYERHGDLKNAFDMYSEAARLDPSSVKVHTNLVHIAELLGKDLPPELAATPVKKEVSQ
ncbi:MAG TPA: tetratricopeptide repeat protein [Polyangia bacterium]|jgi:Flp pilus assembly protein TadD